MATPGPAAPAIEPNCLLCWTLLLLFVNSVTADHSEVLPKSKVSLSPPWSRIFREENVTLTCQLENGTLLAGNTIWNHNGSKMNETSPNLKITFAQELDSGNYTCKGENSQLSDPVHLSIFSDYLLLQATAENLQEGQPLFLQCHSWKNWKVDKVTFYKNNVSLKYWYDNHNISMEKATYNDNGKYHCEGRVQMVKRTSEAVFITVYKTHSNLPWLHLLVPALLLLLMAMDSALFILTKQQLTQLLQSTKKGRKATGSDPHPQRDRAKT